MPKIKNSNATFLRNFQEKWLCLKIIEKVSFTTLRAKRARLTFCQTVLPDKLILTEQKLMENAKIQMQHFEGFYKKSSFLLTLQLRHSGGLDHDSFVSNVIPSPTPRKSSKCATPWRTTGPNSTSSSWLAFGAFECRKSERKKIFALHKVSIFITLSHNREIVYKSILWS